MRLATVLIRYMFSFDFVSQGFQYVLHFCKLLPGVSEKRKRFDRGQWQEFRSN